MKKNQKSENAKMDSHQHENPSLSIPATNTLIHDGKTYFIHPIYNNYGCSKDGYVINKKTLIPRKGRLRKDGYLDISVRDKLFYTRNQAHRMIWEAVNQKIIPQGYQIHHRDSDKENNLIDNLELVTRKENMSYHGQLIRGKKISKKQNVEMKCEVFYYHHIYTNFGANKYGQIYNKKTKRVSTGNLKSSGYLATKLSQINLPGKSFYVHRFVYDCFYGDIPDGMQINHIDSNRQNNCIKNLELMTRSENMKHAFAAKKYKTKIEIKTEKPIKSIKMDIELEESDDELTEDEKQKIDKKFNIMMKKINNGDFPFKKQLQEHLPGMEFW